jgi:acetyltransferase-like isoleucine patch superfamily enzyme
MTYAATARRWVKTRNSPVSNLAYRIITGARTTSMPVMPGIHAGLYHLHRTVISLLGHAARILWYTPLFQSQLTHPAQRLHVYSGMPLILGSVAITFGDRVRISGQSTISGRSTGTFEPVLLVGDNVDIGWQTTIAVGRRVEIGNNVRIAGRAFLAGYPGHPLDAAERAAGLPEHDDQVGDIVLEDDVWLASGVSVMAGVRIGRGTIVAAGSVVAKDLPPGVIAAGVPARIVRHLKPECPT